jgi:hypothetical protein
MSKGMGSIKKEIWSKYYLPFISAMLFVSLKPWRLRVSKV